MPSSREHKRLRGATLDVVLGIGSLSHKKGPQPSFFLVNSKSNRVTNVSKGRTKLSSKIDAENGKESKHSNEGSNGKGQAGQASQGGKSDKKENTHSGAKDGKQAETAEKKADAQKGQADGKKNDSTAKASPQAAAGDKAATAPAKDAPAKATAEPAKAAVDVQVNVATHGGGSAFTAEQDAMLMAMKAEGKTWKDITEAIGHGKSSCTARFKELNSQTAPVQQPAPPAEKAAPVKAAEKPASPPSACTSCKAKAAKAQQPSATKPSKPVTETKHGVPTPPASVSSGYSMHRGQRAPMSALLDFLDDGMNVMSTGAMRRLYYTARCDDEEKWLRIASRFYDQTGMRVDPEDIRDALIRLQSLGGR